LVALTKLDKLNKTTGRARAVEIAASLHLEPEQVISFSSQTGEGRLELLEAILDLVGTVPQREES
jgi:GTP-binding protein EngB required for normal cell division